MWVKFYVDCIYTSVNSYITRVHRIFCLKVQYFLFFRAISWGLLSLTFHMLENTMIRPSISHLRAIYWAIKKHWRRRSFESKETIVKFFPIAIYLSLHPFILVDWTIYVHLPSSPLSLWSFLCMEDWSGGGLGGGTWFLGSKEFQHRWVSWLHSNYNLVLGMSTCIRYNQSNMTPCKNLIFFEAGLLV